MTGETTGVGRRQRDRYHVEHVRLGPDEESQERLREVLRAGERREWHLVGVAGGLPEGDAFLFWDTQRPSFGRTNAV